MDIQLTALLQVECAVGNKHLLEEYLRIWVQITTQYIQILTFV